ncbi:MAG: zinc-binding dehydrogenase [Bryobacteraceae bacterium]
MMVSFGQASGAVPPFSIAQLNTLGSLYLTRPSLGYYTSTREELIWRADELFTAIAGGKLKITIDRTYPLAEAGQAHTDLEARRTSGKVLLTNS